LESLSDDPDEWFTKLDKINNKLAAIDECYRKQDYELKAHLIANLPEGYKDVITKINGSEDKYTTKEIEKEIQDKWKQSFKKSDKVKTKEQQAFQAQSGFKKWFKGVCRKCGK
jgi:hypothetical protein